MRRACAVLAGLSFLGGCGPSEEHDVYCKLEAGDRAIVAYTPNAVKYGKTGEEDEIYLVTKEKGTLGFVQVASLAPGTAVTVGFDPGYYEMTRKKLDEIASETSDPKVAEAMRSANPYRKDAPDPGSGGRPVQVVVESGEHKGASGRINRDNLRPQR